MWNNNNNSHSNQPQNPYAYGGAASGYGMNGANGAPTVGGGYPQGAGNASAAPVGNPAAYGGFSNAPAGAYPSGPIHGGYGQPDYGTNPAGVASTQAMMQMQRAGAFAASPGTQPQVHHF